MTLNPQSTDDEQHSYSDPITVEGGTVVGTQSHTSGDTTSHHVEVTTDHFNEPIMADVLVPQYGAVTIPTEGTRVTVAFLPNNRAVVLGQRYPRDNDPPAFEPGERVVGHPTTDSSVRFTNGGDVILEGDSGTKVELKSNGDVVINDGTTRPVTDVTTTTDSDGHVTDISITRASDTFVKSP